MSDEAVDLARETVLVVDDEPANIDVLRGILTPAYRVKAATNGQRALEIMASDNPPDLMLLDVMMPEMSGYDVLEALSAQRLVGDTPVIFVTALAAEEDEARGLALGAVDYITKPVRPALVTARVATQLRARAARKRLEQELRVAQALAQDAAKKHELPLSGPSIAMGAVRQSIVAHAGSDEPLLLIGPRGAGQHAVAHTVHMRSARRQRPFIVVDCADLASSGTALIFSAPPGAGPAATGRGTLAAGGTLYLDQVERLPASAQHELDELLRGDRPDVDVRVIAYAGEDLDAAARRADFLDTAVARLSRNRLAVPSLAERRDDLPVLAAQIVRNRARTLGKVGDRLSERSLERIASYHWPGNVDELESVLERAVDLANAPVVEVDDALFGQSERVGGYLLTKRLGQGGMGDVWLGRHAMLARPAAIKLIREGAMQRGETARERLVERFQREAQVTARLRSPHTVELYDYGVTNDGALYYVMEHLDGIDLQEYLLVFNKMPVHRAVYLLMQACDSLAEAHAHGLVHRDIKPANLFLSRLGVEPDFLKVLDFGIVKDTEEQAEMTAAGIVPGTAGYLAPELAVGGETPTPAADIYSLGCVAFKLVTGEAVFSAANVVGLNTQHALVPAPAPSSVLEGIPAAVDEVILACLEKSPAARPKDAREVRERLAAIELSPPWTRVDAERWWRDNGFDEE